MSCKVPIDEQCAFKPYDKSKGKVLSPYYELRWRRKELGLDAESDPFNDYETASSGQNTPDDGGVSTDNQIASAGQITSSGDDAPDKTVVPVDQDTPDANDATEYASEAPENTDTQAASLFQQTASDDYVPNDTVSDSSSSSEDGSLTSRNQHEYIAPNTNAGNAEEPEPDAVTKTRKQAWSPVRVGVRWKA